MNQSIQDQYKQLLRKYKYILEIENTYLDVIEELRKDRLAIEDELKHIDALLEFTATLT